MKIKAVFAWGLATALTPTIALGFAPPSMHGAHGEGHDGRLLLPTGSVRVQPATSWTTPKAAGTRWTQFLQATPGTWRAQWDADTEIPTRIYGSGIHFEGATADATRAEAAAREVLNRHLALLAPGAAPADLVLVANDYDAASALRTVAFEVRYAGFEVLGAHLNVRIKKDRLFVLGSAGLPQASLELPRSRVRAATLERNALANTAGKDVRLYAPAAAPVILPLVHDDGRVSSHLVSEVVVHVAEPLGRWSVFVDVENGTEVARRQNLRFASGTLQINAPERRPTDTRLDWDARDMNVSLGGQNTSTDGAGVVTWTGTDPVSGTMTPLGSEVRVDNDAGARATFDFTVSDGGTAVWNDANDEEIDAQLNTFIHARVVKERARIIAPNNNWHADPVQATVNIGNSCNAFSDGTTINFFQSSRQCENTGRLADVVHHEYGHSFHAHVIIRGAGAFDGALSEGASDYIAATITNDPGMGRGFFRTNAPLRHIDPPNDEAVWPEDIGESHTTGLIFAGAMWDLRKQLIVDFGDEAAAVAHTDQLWHQALRRSRDIPSSYVEVLAADDDDGDLSNGTPNRCAINDAFARHGLADVELVSVPIGKPVISEMLRVQLPVGESNNTCPGANIASVDLDWRVRGSTDGGAIPMVSTMLGYEEQIPSQTQGNVVQYRIEVTLDSGEKILLPDNAADPYYEYFIGEATEIYCTGFEVNDDPEGEGWTHALLAGEDREGADDWQFGPPMAAANSGDPQEAFSGNQVAGNDLGGGNYNGLYQPSKQNELRSPWIAVSEFEVVRLQYRRWLNIEDGDFDRAEILANDEVVWANYATGNQGDTHHTDKEWRFHDVDVTDEVRQGALQIAFRLQSDRGLEFGGWTLDDFCIVGYNTSPVPVCGNGQVEEGEACDDGNAASGDGCEADCSITQLPPACGDGNLDPGEMCDDGNLISGDGCDMTCTPTIVDPGCQGADCNPVTDPNEELTQLDDTGCGCTATERADGASGWAVLALLFGLVARRRRR
ncbi:MAG: MYXO-CTERM sorting domain-containing protein [Deltaproteobacteria bacterium]